MSWSRLGGRIRWAFTIAVISLFVLFGIVTGEPPVIPSLVIATVLVTILWLARSRIPSFLRPRNALQLLGVFWVVLFAGAAVLDYTLNLPDAERESARLAADLERIPQPSLAVRSSVSVSTKPGSSLVDATYVGPVSWAQLRAHFDRILADDGWTFVEDRPLLEWGADIGARSACYRKGNDLAHIDTPGTHGGYAYSFSLFWHPRPEAC